MSARTALRAGGVLAALACAALTAVQPALGLALAGLALAVAMLSARTELLVPAVLFALYANIPAVLVKYWGVPLVAAAALPALLFLPLARSLLTPRGALIVPREAIWLLVYLAAACFGALFARHPELARAALVDLVLEGLLLYLLVVNAVRTPETARRVLWALLAAGFVMGIVPLMQQASGAFDRNFGGFGQLHEIPFQADPDAGDEGGVGQHRLAGPIGEINRYSQVMLLLVPIGVLFALRERRISARFLALGITAVVLGGFALAFSRGGAVAAVMVFGVMLALRVISLRQAALLALGGCMVLAVFPQYLVRLSTLPGVSTLMGQQASVPDGAVKGRMTEMIAAAQVFADHPLVGVGPGMFPHYAAEYGNELNIRRLNETREAHNLYLHVAAEGGLLGLVGFFGLIATTLWRLVRARRQLQTSAPEQATLVTAVLLMIVTYLATGVFLHLSYQRYFWLAMALGAAVASLPQPRPAALARDLA